MSAGCNVRCPACGHTTRIEIAEIDRLRLALAAMTKDRDDYRAKAASAATLLQRAKDNPFGSLFGGL